MTPWKLIALRLFNVTLGRLAPFSALLRWVLLRRLIHGGRLRYVQSARYFTWDDFEVTTATPPEPGRGPSDRAGR